MTDRAEMAMALAERRQEAIDARASGREKLAAELGITPELLQCIVTMSDPQNQQALAQLRERVDLRDVVRTYQKISADCASVLDITYCTKCGVDWRMSDLDAITSVARRAWIRDRCSMLGCCRTCADAMWEAPSTPPANGISSALSRARRAGLPATLTQAQWDLAVAAFGDRCAFCGGPWNIVEHLTPIELGGGTVAGNCAPACTTCNVRKARRTLEEFAPRDASRIRRTLEIGR